MKIVKAIIEAIEFIPKYNQPYFSKKMWIKNIVYFYDDGGYDIHYNTSFGFEAEEEFFIILDDSCEVDIILEYQEYYESFYENNDFKNACFNRTQENPYQLPDWKTIK